MRLDQRTDDICGQLTRYSGEVASEELADLLDVIVDINDDLWHGRDASLLVENIAKAKTLLDEIKPL